MRPVATDVAWLAVSPRGLIIESTTNCPVHRRPVAAGIGYSSHPLNQRGRRPTTTTTTTTRPRLGLSPVQTAVTGRVNTELYSTLLTTSNYISPHAAARSTCMSINSRTSRLVRLLHGTAFAPDLAVYLSPDTCRPLRVSSVSTIISTSTGRIFTRFSAFGSAMAADDDLNLDF